ncbi:hypothetical protein HBB16_12645 [Pseudonocardia sp. MCCB 268]|nr:hypothetical protein [Pseudonocardia cytotoxica]
MIAPRSGAGLSWTRRRSRADRPGSCCWWSRPCLTWCGSASVPVVLAEIVVGHAAAGPQRVRRRPDHWACGRGRVLWLSPAYRDAAGGRASHPGAGASSCGGLH